MLLACYSLLICFVITSANFFLVEQGIIFLLLTLVPGTQSPVGQCPGIDLKSGPRFFDGSLSPDLARVLPKSQGMILPGASMRVIMADGRERNGSWMA